MLSLTVHLGWYENKADAQLTADAATGSGTNTGKFDEYTLTSGNPQEQNYREILLKVIDCKNAETMCRES